MALSQRSTRSNRGGLGNTGGSAGSLGGRSMSMGTLDNTRAQQVIATQNLANLPTRQAIDMYHTIGGKGASRQINQKDHDDILEGCVETHHRPNREGDNLLATWGDKHGQGRHTKVLSRLVVVPTEEEVVVPVVRKEAHRTTVKVTVEGNKLIPSTLHKKVDETKLNVERREIDGIWEKRALPDTKSRHIPFTEFESKPVPVTVEVPKEEIVTRKGFRTDKHVVSKVVDIQEEHHYAMKPVFDRKGDVRITDTGEHHAFKKKHGAPVWDDHVHDGWLGKPKTPRPHYAAYVPRPESAGSIRSRGGHVRKAQSLGALQ